MQVVRVTQRFNYGHDVEDVALYGPMEVDAAAALMADIKAHLANEPGLRSALAATESFIDVTLLDVMMADGRDALLHLTRHLT